MTKTNDSETITSEDVKLKTLENFGVNKDLEPEVSVEELKKELAEAKAKLAEKPQVVTLNPFGIAYAEDKVIAFHLKFPPVIKAGSDISKLIKMIDGSDSIMKDAIKISRGVLFNTLVVVCIASAELRIKKEIESLVEIFGQSLRAAEASAILESRKLDG